MKKAKDSSTVIDICRDIIVNVEEIDDERRRTGSLEFETAVNV